MFEYGGNKHWVGKEELSERLMDVFYCILFMSCAAVIFGYSSDPLYVLGLCVMLALLFIRSRTQKKAKADQPVSHLSLIRFCFASAFLS